MNSRHLSTFAGMLFVLLFTFPPSSAQAEETFSTTVKIIGYEQLLNGYMVAIAEGSGTLITSEGEILTNAHVVMNDKIERPFDGFSVCVSETPQKAPECRFTASLLQVDPKIDLARLKIESNVAWGALPTTFPFLDPQLGTEPQEAAPVTIRGFSASGGVTMNTTQGQISGFEEYNGHTYLKTDADIDAGNSGGTMLDSEGHFIGVPTYAVSYYESVGRALSITEVKSWLQVKNTETYSMNPDASKKIISNQQRIHEAENTGKLAYMSPPGLSFQVPEGWTFESLDDEGFVLIKKDNDNVYLQGRLHKELFKSDLTLQERLKKARETIGPDAYKEEKIISIHGHEAIDFYDINAYGTQHFLILPYGYHTILLDYFIPKEDQEGLTKAISGFLDSFEFTTPDSDNAKATTVLEEKNYPFSLQVAKGWRIEKLNDSEGHLALAGRNVKEKDTLDIHYSPLPKESPALTPKEGLKYDLENFVPYDAKVIFKSPDLVVDGLKGWVIVYEYSVGEQKTKVASATILDPEYEFYFDYEGDATVFEEGLKGYMFALNHFKSKRYDAPDSVLAIDQKGIYKVPALTSTGPVPLTDIEGHRFEKNILNLVEKGVITGYEDHTFRPEELVNRAAALKIILQALRTQQVEKEETPYVMPENFSAFPDVAPTVWFATYVAEGLDKKIIAGYPDGTFKGAEPVNLAEALKMTEEAFGVKVWSGETDPWYKKYVDKAYDLDLLPRGLEDPSKLLTRAELAHVVDQLMMTY